MSLPFTCWRSGAALSLLLLPASVGIQGPIQARGTEPVLRVLLQQATSLDLAAGPAPLRLADNQGRTLLELRAGQAIRLRAGAQGLQAALDQGNGSDRLVSLPLRQLWIDPLPSPRFEPLFLLQRRQFRGRLQVRSEGSGLQAINHIGVESYLPSVVGSEMPASWPQAALRAQAVAARTYALRQRRPAAPFDLKASDASQVYKGVEAETTSTRQAVASTRSQVLMDGSGLIDAVFHSSSGGSTENSGEIWNRQFPYLVSVPDFDFDSPVRNWEKRFEPWQLRQAFPEIGGAQRIQVLSTTSSGRVRQARVMGATGGLTLSGGDLRRRLGLRSTLARFVFEGQTDWSALGGGGATARAAAGGGADSGGAPRPIPLPVVSAAQNSQQNNSLRTNSRSVPRPSPLSPQRRVSTPPPQRTATPGSLSALLDAVASAVPWSQPKPEGRRDVPLDWSRNTNRGLGSSLLVIGRGFGHGVGMSQWGAYGLARRGEGYEEILRHFYRGAQLRPFTPL